MNECKMKTFSLFAILLIAIGMSCMNAEDPYIVNEVTPSRQLLSKIQWKNHLHLLPLIILRDLVHLKNG